MGIPSLKDFWRALGEEGEEGWSGCGYEAVRNYHYDREAPVSYLARVCERFPTVNAEYLTTGKGEPLRREVENREARQEALWETLRTERPALSGFAPQATVALMDAVDRFGLFLEMFEDTTEERSDWERLLVQYIGLSAVWPIEFMNQIAGRSEDDGWMYDYMEASNYIEMFAVALKTGLDAGMPALAQHLKVRTVGKLEQDELFPIADNEEEE